MNDSNNDNDNNAIESYSVDIVKAEDISIDSASIASVEAAIEVETIADQIESASKVQLSKLVDIEKAIIGLSVGEAKSKNRNLDKPIIAKAARIIRKEKIERPTGSSKTTAPLRATNRIAAPKIVKDPQSESANFSPVIDFAKSEGKKISSNSIGPATRKEKQVNSVTANNSEFIKPTIIQGELAVPVEKLSSTVTVMDELYKDDNNRWRNQDGSFASKDAIQQQREKTEDSSNGPESQEGFLSRIAEVVTGGGRGEEGKSALGRVALGGFYDMGAEAIEIAKDAAGYASQVGEVFRKDKPESEEIADKVKSDDVIAGKKDEQIDIKDELDEQTALLADIADKDFSGGGNGSSLVDDISDFAGGGGSDKKKTKPRGRIGRAFDKLKSKSPKLAKASNFIGSGINKVKGLFGRGAATAATTGATSAASTGSKVLAGAGKLLSKLAVPLVAVTAGYSKYQDLKERDDLSGNQKNTITASTAVGAGGGALAGAAAGAAIGSIVPVVGTLIGGLIGGALGAWAGGEGGSMAGEAIASVMDSPIESAKVQTEAEKELLNPFGNASEPLASKVSPLIADNSTLTSEPSGTRGVMGPEPVKGIDSEAAQKKITTSATSNAGAVDLASIESADLSVPVISAVNNNKIEQVESARPKSSDKLTDNNKTDQASLVVKNDPALVSEMKLMNKNLTKANNPVKRDRNKAIMPYDIPKSFENHSLRLIAMDIR
jgi:hypothetical protein